jgi:hypothetical protein
MNERIRELVRQAGGHFSTRNLMSNPVQQRESIELWDDKIEKFAVLIIQECARKVVEDMMDNGWYADTGELKKHFGVEE